MIAGSRQRIAVVVPAFNEERHLERVIRTMPTFVDEVVVVDDGSTDGTAEILGRLGGELARLVAVRHRRNEGVGAALRTGYLRAVDDGMDVVAVMAGDGQMHPDDLALVVAPVLRGEADYVKGNRFHGRVRPEGMPRLRFAAIGPLAVLTRVASGYGHLRDPQSGFTAASRECLADIDLDRLHPGYGYPNHLLILLAAARKRVVEVPVRAVYGQGETSGIRPLEVAPTLLALLGKGLLWRLASERAGSSAFRGARQGSPCGGSPSLREASRR